MGCQTVGIEFGQISSPLSPISSPTTAAPPPLTQKCDMAALGTANCIVMHIGPSSLLAGRKELEETSFLL